MSAAHSRNSLGMECAALTQREKCIGEFERPVTALMPILSCHIDASRDLAETNITQLTKCFSRLFVQSQSIIEATASVDADEEGAELPVPTWPGVDMGGRYNGRCNKN